MSDMNHTWFILAHELHGLNSAIDAVKELGLRYFYPMRAIRSSPISGRPSLEEDLFPGYLFVEAPNAKDLLYVLPNLPGVSRIVRTEFGRPRELSPYCVEQIRIYCRLKDGEDPNSIMRTLDILSDGDRIDYFLRNCYHWQ